MTLTKLQVEEVMRCRGGDTLAEQAQGFLYFCRTYVLIEDKDTHTAIPFRMYRCQEEVAEKLVRRKWLRILKARRLGFTWLIVVFAVWLVTFFEMRTIGYIVHKKEFAHDFVKRCKFVIKRLPEWMRVPMTADSRSELEFDDRGHGCWIRAFAATPGAADSVAADLVCVDQAPQIETLHPGLLKSIHQSVCPTVETAHGAIIDIGTSEGPTGYFYEGWQASEDGNDKFENVFYGWYERPGRTAEWYAQLAAQHKADPAFVPRHYPESPEQAFSHPEGRIYPSFSRQRHVLRFTHRLERVTSIEAPQIIPSEWRRYRAIDWGARDPFTCCWLTVVPGDPSGFSIDPSCKDAIREFIAYRRKEHSEYPMDRDNHVCDAMRYAVVTFNLVGHVHLYKLLYVPNSADKGLSLLDLAADIRRMSEGEDIRCTVADRSRTDSILLLHRHDIRPIVGHVKPAMDKTTHYAEIEQGIVRLNALIVASHPLKPEKPVDEVAVEARKLRKQSRGLPTDLVTSMREHAILEKDRERKQARRRMRFARSW